MREREVSNVRTRSILLVGHWRWDIYEEALATGFRANRWRVIPFRFDDYLSDTLVQRIQARIKAGPAIVKLNKALIKICGKQMPGAVFFYATDLIVPVTLKCIKTMNPRVTLIAYHNDNPFVGARKRFKWRHYLNGIPLVDIVLVYRPSNIVDAQRYGASRVHLLPPYYLSNRHRPLPAASSEDYCDLIYIGHYEHDGRDEVIDYLLRNGIPIRIYGTGWEAVARRRLWLSVREIRPVRGEEYSRLLSSAKIALVFLSKANQDVWTRRCFEIPACGTLMLAPRNRELEKLFADGHEAVYYDSKEDLLQKIQYYLVHEEDRQRIAYAGWQRCVRDEHNEIGWAKQVLEIIKQVRKTTDSDSVY